MKAIEKYCIDKYFLFINSTYLLKYKKYIMFVIICICE